MEVSLGIDYGDARTGVAIAYGDGPAVPSGAVDSSGGRNSTARAVCGIAKEKNAGLVVIGLPYNMDGSKGRRAVLTEKFAKALEKCLAESRLSVRIGFFDERLTSRSAESELRSVSAGTPAKGASDSVAASIILQNYLDSRKAGNTGVVPDIGGDENNG